MVRSEGLSFAIEGAGAGGREGPAMRSRKHRSHLQVLGLRCVKEKVLNTREVSRESCVLRGSQFYLQHTVLGEGREVGPCQLTSRAEV